MCACVRVCFEICLYKRETHFIQDKWPSNNSASNLSKINHTLIAQSQCFKGMLGGTDGRATIYWSSASTQSGGCALVSLVSSLGDYSSGSHFTDKMARSWLDSFLSAMATGFLCHIRTTLLDPVPKPLITMRTPSGALITSVSPQQQRVSDLLIFGICLKETTQGPARWHTG